MRKMLLTVIVVGVLLGCATTNPKKSSEWDDKAVEYYNNGDYAKAIAALTKSIKYDSSNFNAYYRRGIVYFLSKEYDLAIKDYNLLIENVQDFPFAYITRGDAYGAKGLYHKAFADYQTGLEGGFDEVSSFNVDKTNKSTMWFCGVIYREILINYVLDKSDEATKYMDFLTTVCNKNDITSEEVETFYRDNIHEIVSAFVDEYAFLNEGISADALAEIKETITKYMLNPSQQTYNSLESLYRRNSDEKTGWAILFTMTNLDSFATGNLGILLLNLKGMNIDDN